MFNWGQKHNACLCLKASNDDRVLTNDLEYIMMQLKEIGYAVSQAQIEEVIVNLRSRLTIFHSMTLVSIAKIICILIRGYR